MSETTSKFTQAVRYLFPYNPQVPKLVRIYGTFIIVCGCLAFFGSLAFLVFIFADLFFELGTFTGNRHAASIAKSQFAVNSVFGLFVLLLGRGLRAGSRYAVYFLSFCAAVGLVGMVLLRSEGVVTPFGVFRTPVIFAGLLIVFYLPPLISAFRNWSAFQSRAKPTREKSEGEV